MNEETYPFVTRKLQQAIENGSTPGVAMLVEQDGAVVFRHAEGYAQRYPVVKPLYEDTLFDLASLTKVIATTTAVMLLLRDQTITLDDPVQRYVPEFPHDQITLRHLLTHSAGFPAWAPLYEEIQREADRQSRPDFIGSPEAKAFMLTQICQTPLASAPGEQCVYDDLGFILLGHAIEQITGVDLDQFCEEHIFAPLGMINTFFHKQGEAQRPGEYAATERCEWRRRIVCGEVHDENAYAMGGIAGHAGLFSTLDDVQRFMHTLHQCYQGASTFIPRPIVQQFFTRQHLPPDSTFALGWDTPSPQGSTGGTLLSPESVGHAGFTGTSVWLDLSRSLLLLLFSNRIHPSRVNEKFKKMRPRIHDAAVIATDRAADST
jgi:serine-type D-Ala-D-Ala carboxypeptidase